MFPALFVSFPELINKKLLLQLALGDLMVQKVYFINFILCYVGEQRRSMRCSLKPKYLIAENYRVISEQLEHREVAISSLDSYHTAPGVDRIDNAFRYFRFQWWLW